MARAFPLILLQHDAESFMAVEKNLNMSAAQSVEERNTAFKLLK